MLLVETPDLDPVQDTYEMEAQLSGVPYILRLEWSGSRWYLDLLTSEREPLVTGQPLVLWRPVTLLCTDPGRPAGHLLLASETDDQSEATRADLGARCRLMYVPS
jgi:hypothetical protein